MLIKMILIKSLPKDQCHHDSIKIPELCDEKGKVSDCFSQNIFLRIFNSILRFWIKNGFYLKLVATALACEGRFKLNGLY